MYAWFNMPVPIDGLDFDKKMINSVRIEKNKITIHLPNGVYTIEPEVDAQGRAYFDIDWFAKPLPKSIGL